MADVQNLRTTATYDPATETFDLHTPHSSARKDYIGNAARDGRMAVVFAQLVSGGESHGVHAWLVPIRDVDGRHCDGVTITDDGPKAGLNGVDNGWLSFHHVSVPRDALLDRYSQVAADGTTPSRSRRSGCAARSSTRRTPARRPRSPRTSEPRTGRVLTRRPPSWTSPPHSDPFVVPEDTARPPVRGATSA